MGNWVWLIVVNNDNSWWSTIHGLVDVGWVVKRNVWDVIGGVLFCEFGMWREVLLWKFWWYLMNLEILSVDFNDFSSTFFQQREGFFQHAGLDGSTGSSQQGLSFFCVEIYGGPQSWRIPNSWMVFVRENPNLKWMITRGNLYIIHLTQSRVSLV